MKKLWSKLKAWIRSKLRDELSDLQEELERDKPSTTPEEDEPAEESTGTNRFLWKPVSETRPGAAVLLPARIRQEDISGELRIDGRTHEVLEHRPGYANGNRVHYFLRKTGGQYGRNVRVEVPLKSGGEAWTVPDGSKRHTEES